MQLLEKEFLEKSTSNRWDQNKDMREILNLWHLQLQQTLSRAQPLPKLIKLHSKGLFILYSMSGLQQNITRYTKGKKTKIKQIQSE